MLENKRYLFDDITSCLLTGNCDPNECINKLADVIYNISFQLKGKTFVHKTGVFPKHITRKVSP